MALRRIALRDYVIVRELELDLSHGFTVLTGETGAGKSILIDALQLALGSRADSAFVREGADRLEVSVEFDAESPSGSPRHSPDEWLNDWLDAGGFARSEFLLLRRTVDAQGRSRGWINGSPATAAQLRELGDQLIDIHGQHAWQSLTRPAAVRDLLDAYAGIAPGPMATSWQMWRDAIQTLARARSTQDAAQRDRERLQWQIAELMKLAPGADEWDELSANHTRAANAQALIEAAEGARAALEDDEGSAAAALARAHALLENAERIEPEFVALSEILASSLAQMTDAAHSLHAYLRRTDIDPTHLAALDERMGAWVSMARRYKRAPAELPVLLALWQSELAALDAAFDLEQLEQAEKAALERYIDDAKKVAKLRRQAAPRLSQAVTGAMQQLGMKGGIFKIALQALAEPASHGLDDIAFLVSGHPGATPRAIGKVASGGELSRIALAIAVTTSQLGQAQTLIFDEVDSGVGGAVAEAVGRLMRRLGHDRQVLAVTHLPQVAANADQHLVVAKAQARATSADTPNIQSGVAALDGEARAREIARMLGGERISETTMAHAREMLGTPLAERA